MHDKLHKTADELLDHVCAMVKDKGLGNVNPEWIGEYTDAIKDLKEAEYYALVSKAMRDEEEAEKMGYRRMGYDRYRYANGEFAPKGRGHLGYTPMHIDMNERMGYPSPMEMGTYQEYNTRRRNYTANKTAENKQAMEMSAEHHLRETMDNMREVLSEVDQPMRQKIKTDLKALVNEL